ncbi:hypothetical protein TKK_0017842 [Trichogramma kaykai]
MAPRRRCARPWSSEVGDIPIRISPLLRVLAAVGRLQESPDGTDWVPKPHSQICSAHFAGNQRSIAESSPSYIPIIFPVVYTKSTKNEGSSIQRKRLSIEWESCRIEDYIRVTQCFKCLDFNHIARVCNADHDPLCARCGEPHEGKCRKMMRMADLPEDGFACPVCRRVFSTAIGRGQHVKKGHREYANAQINVDRVNRRWLQEDINRLAQAEANVAVGVPILESLQLSMPGRTLDSIKGVRKKAEYKARVAFYRDQARAASERVQESIEEAERQANEAV